MDLQVSKFKFKDLILSEWLLHCINIKSHVENVLCLHIYLFEKTAGQLQYHLNT